MPGQEAGLAKYLVLNGINYPDGKGGEKRAEPGDVVDDLPERGAKWLERDGHITHDLKTDLPDASEPEEVA